MTDDGIPMAKPKQKRTPLEPPSGDLPLLVRLKAGKWHDIMVDFTDDIVPAKDGGPDEKWSCYRVTIEDDSNGRCENEEVPFWAQEEFFMAVVEAYDDGDDEINLRYRRTVHSDGRNEAEFRKA